MGSIVGITRVSIWVIGALNLLTKSQPIGPKVSGFRV